MALQSIKRSDGVRPDTEALPTLLEQSLGPGESESVAGTRLHATGLSVGLLTARPLQTVHGWPLPPLTPRGLTESSKTAPRIWLPPLIPPAIPILSPS